MKTLSLMIQLRDRQTICEGLFEEVHNKPITWEGVEKITCFKNIQLESLWVEGE